MVKSSLAKQKSVKMYSYNRIHNDYDNNVVRVELNSSYRPRIVTAPTSSQRDSSRVSIDRNETFTKRDRPSNIVRSETFILKHHQDDSSPDEMRRDERPDYNTFSRSKKKSHSNGGGGSDDKSNFSTYTRSEKRGNECSLEGF